jgi:hypothetical protein
VAGLVDVDARRPACDFPPAARAGSADVGGSTYDPEGTQAIGCYGVRGDASLLVLPEERAVVLGTGTPLTNDRLDDEGNAALVLGILGGAEQVLWLVPDPGREVPSGEQRPLSELMPSWLLVGLLQLAVAVVLLALWRARRLGRVVEEPLPVVVRAAEAVEGRGRLYRAAGARGPAAEALRSGVRERAAARLGLPPNDRPRPRRRCRGPRRSRPGRGRRAPVRCATVGRRRPRAPRRRPAHARARADPPPAGPTARTRSRPAMTADAGTGGEAAQPGRRRVGSRSLTATAAKAVAPRARKSAGVPDAAPASAPRAAPPAPSRPRTPAPSLVALRQEVAKAVIGQDAVVTGLVVALLCRGTCCSRACPARPRRCWCARSPRRCRWTPSGCSSRPT